MKNTTIDEMIRSGAFIPTVEYDIGSDYGTAGFFEQLEAIKQGLVDG